MTITKAPFTQIYVIINPAAGQNEPILNVLNAVLRPAGVKWEVFITNEPGDARKYASLAKVAGVMPLPCMVAMAPSQKLRAA